MLTNERIWELWREANVNSMEGDMEFARLVEEEAVRLEREAAKPLIYAAEKALHEMCHTNSPRESFTDAVDALDAAITAIRARGD